MTAITKSKNRLRSLKTNTKKTTTESESKLFTMSVIKGFAVGTAVLFIFISLFALLMLKYDPTEKAIPIMAIVSCATGAFAGGFWSGRCIGKKGMLIGSVTGIPIAVLISVMSIASRESELGSLLAVTIFIVLFMACVGGIGAVNSKFAKRK
ncbi:MAG: TIGR04086 family membrane protein [Oscillospiraceae bacterium]|jgi:putative membrane protein (TIGR04086 family)|nr:TIGR04086 family membrane protein [Oscillospiraceae bacterium]